MLSQSVHEIELILIDDGSTDGSLSVARSFTIDPRVRLFVDGHRRHLPTRLNEIVREARGVFVARMDGDDISHPERLARELLLFERSAALDAVGTWAALIDDRGEAFAVIAQSPRPPLRRSALERGLLVHASMVGRRSWLVAHPYDEELSRAEDRDLWCRTVSHSRFEVVPEPLYLVQVASSGPGFITDYRASQRQNRLLFARYGPATLGPLGTLLACLGSYGKTALMSAAHYVSVEECLVRRRGRAPTIEEVALIEEALLAAEHLGSAKR